MSQLTIIADNLSSHKGPRVSELIEATGARLLYLPPYTVVCEER